MAAVTRRMGVSRRLAAILLRPALLGTALTGTALLRPFLLGTLLL